MKPTRQSLSIVSATIVAALITGVATLVAAEIQSRKRTTSSQDFASISVEANLPIRQDNAADWARGKSFIAQKRFDEALPHVRNAAESGNGEAAFQFGQMFEFGEGGLAKDDVLAVKWYRNGIVLGNTDCMSRLGVMYMNGRGGLSQDDAQAVSWFSKAVEAGNPRGMNNLAVMYESGRGGLKKDPTQALSWMQKAATQGVPVSMLNLGRMYSDGIGVPSPNPSEAKHWFEKAAETGNTEAMVALGDVATLQSERENWFRTAALAGDRDGMFRLGALLEDICQKQRDAKEAPLFAKEKDALQWIQKAADLRNPLAEYELGSLYERGQLGLPQDLRVAVECYERAALEDDVRALLRLGRLYLFGSAVTAKDQPKAITLLKRAADQHSVFASGEAMQLLGRAYEYGWGVPANKQQAYSWFKQANSNGAPYDNIEQDIEKLRLPGHK